MLWLLKIYCRMGIFYFSTYITYTSTILHWQSCQNNKSVHTVTCFAQWQSLTCVRGEAKYWKANLFWKQPVSLPKVWSVLLAISQKLKVKVFMREWVTQSKIHLEQSRHFPTWPNRATTSSSNKCLLMPMCIQTKFERRIDNTILYR